MAIIRQCPKFGREFVVSTELLFDGLTTPRSTVAEVLVNTRSCVTVDSTMPLPTMLNFCCLLGHVLFAESSDEVTVVGSQDHHLALG